jgi:uncharacterized protein with ParB-like and HNH nuclease domain
MNNEPLELCLEEIFAEDNYIIPLYQRNYAWEEREVTQLIQDIWDYGELNTDNNYYIGTLVVHKRIINGKPTYAVIDGQQRLTTLNILLSVLKNEHDVETNFGYESKLRFDSRVVSSNTLKMLADKIKKPSDKENHKMRQAYLDMSKKIKQLLNQDKLTLEDFKTYLFENVKLLRVEVPEDTDLNHYFEIMNNRGEQLEKYEILKADFLKFLKDDLDASKAFSMIWDSCADMERYVQYGFTSKIRKSIFGKSWDKIPNNFESIVEAIIDYDNKLKTNKLKTESKSFLELAKSKKLNFEIDITENSEEVRFNSVVNFPNFLLHVLRIFTQEDIPLDDKRLLITFKEVIKNQNNKSVFAKGFALSLLKCKFLFDKYIIKREFKDNKDHWSLQKIKLTSEKKPYYKNTFDSKQPLMLLSMFHVSFPQMIYKHWLNGVLNYLYKAYDNGIYEDKYVLFLERMSSAFYFDRFGELELNYYEIIYKNSCKPSNDKISEVYLHKGTEVQNFIFNRLDYILWKSEVVLKEQLYNIHNIHLFEFSFRSSVEHFYPQNPKPGADLEIVSKDYLNRFGNLCLISRSKNSELSNYSPIAKSEHYSSSSTIESLKQHLMMKEKDKWDEKAILKHGNSMIELLNNHE